MLSSDHGETLGELNVYGDHQTADQITTHVPMVIKWPGSEQLAGRQFDAMHYQTDVSATILQLLGVRVPDVWDGEGFAESLNAGEDRGRDHLVLSQGAWTCQRGVRWDDYMLIQTLHDGYHLYDDVMLFDIREDPHETRNLATTEQTACRTGLSKLEDWLTEMMPDAARGRDPLENVIAEGGPYHVRGQLPGYLKRLRETGRTECAVALAEKYPGEV